MSVARTEAQDSLRRDDAGQHTDLCDWIIALGRFRNPDDIPLLLGFAVNPDPVVRYTVLGVLSWQAALSTAELVEPFLEDRDPVVRKAAEGYSTGYTERWIDPPPEKYS